MHPQLRQGLSPGLPSTLRQLELSMTSLTARAPRLVSSHKLTAAHSFTQKRYVTQRYIQRLKDAEIAWGKQAEEIKAGEKQSFLSMLEERGLVQSIVGDRDTLDKIITNKRIGWYAGVDPTAPSLHVGHMLPFMILGWAYVHGMKAVWLLGGSTAKVGDPTGRSEARPMMKTSVRRSNIANMHMQLKRLGMSFEKYGGRHGYPWEWAWRRVLENNNTWWNKMPFYEVVSTLGAHMRLGPMLGRDNVKTRLAGDGMAFSEFCYPIMQAWDYWYLYQRGVQVQVGGSDQYGNILFGIDAVKSMIKHHPTEELGPKLGIDPDLIKPMGLTTPLLTTASGEKIGKSAGNAIWLDQDMTPSYDLYQYFMRLPDADVERCLKLLTFLPLPKITEIMAEHNKDPSQRPAHHALAREFVEIVHGAPSAIQAEKQHKSLFMANKDSQGLCDEDETAKNTPGSRVEEQVHNLPFTVGSHHITLPRSLVVGQFFHKIIHSAGLASSKQEAFRIIVGNGASVGAVASGKEKMGDAVSYVPIRTWPAYVTENFIIDDSLLIIRIGKWKVKIIKIISDEEFKARKLYVPGWHGTDTLNETDTSDTAEMKQQEHDEDAELMSQKRRIAGRQVRLPSMVDQGKPKIVRLYRDGQRDEDVTIGSDAQRPAKP